MNKYHFNININDRSNTSGTKAQDDCKGVLQRNGYRNIEIGFIKSTFLLPFNLAKLFLTLIYYIFTIPCQSLIMVQYPLKGINRFFKYFIRLLRIKDCKFFCIIHDLESIRRKPGKVEVKKEIEAVLAYDAVISHNTSMSNWLTENGYTKHIEEIVLFDYLIEDNKQGKHISEFDNENIAVAFAGNLNKADFITDLSNASFSFNINLYGPLKSMQAFKNKKIVWHGSFSPEVIVEELEGHFGLIWDGDSTDHISGSMGNYLKYNTPHKTSLYLVAGLPVIIPENAAIADFVRTNNVGFCIKNLAAISKVTGEISNDSYWEMKKIELLMRDKLKNGWYLDQALTK
ncbi:MAG: beta,6-galactofuranosyltransferase, partial [Segetibacter sp.]|nr:beta,6-galactofuranosyltransferase [Segetibacter sp.]